MFFGTAHGTGTAGPDEDAWAVSGQSILQHYYLSTYVNIVVVNLSGTPGGRLATSDGKDIAINTAASLVCNQLGGQWPSHP
jgi:hypothetical protein